MSTRLNTSRTLILGFFIVGTLSMLAYYTLFLKEFSLFSEQDQISVTFEEARGLRAGDSVLVAGVRWGRVASVEYDADAAIDSRITVTATLTQPVEFREGGSFQIQDSTLLGGRVLSIDPGPPSAASLPADAPYPGIVVTSPLDAMGDILAKNSDNFTETLEGLNEIVNNARDGKGVVGQLLNSDELAEDFVGTMKSARGAFENVEEITTHVREGKGTLGRLLASEEIYESLVSSAAELEATLKDARAIAADLEAGKGTVGALLKDEALAAEVRETISSAHDAADSLSEIARKLQEGEGSFGKFLTEDEVYDNIRSISEDFAVVSAKVRAGEGTVGKLLMTEGLYSQVEDALGMITRSLEEYREAAPVTTMTQVLFNAF